VTAACRIMDAKFFAGAENAERQLRATQVRFEQFLGFRTELIPIGFDLLNDECPCFQGKFICLGDLISLRQFAGIENVEGAEHEILFIIQLPVFIIGFECFKKYLRISLLHDEK